MAQSGYTPIQLYYSTTAAAVPVNTNLASGELALNIQDEKLYFKNAAGTVKLLASNATSAPVTSFQTSLSGLTPSTSTTGAVTLAGTLGTSSGGTGLTSFTPGGVVYASSTSALATGSALTFDGQYVSIGTGASSPNGLKFLAFGGGPAANLTVNHSTGEIQNFAATNYFPTWYANNSERMRLDTSGNLGIGTSSPVSKLNVAGTVTATTGIFKATGAPSLSAATSGEAIFAPEGTYGSFLYGYGSTYDVTLGNRTTAVALGVLANSTNVYLAGNVGIGTTSPTTFSGYTVLEVKGPSEGGRITANYNNSIYMTMFANSNGLGYVGTNSAHPAVFITSGTERARISSAGGFSVGTTADPGAGAIYATGNITAYYSDARLKTVSGKIENALDKVAQLSGVYYTNNDTAKSFGYDSDEVQVGVIAQEVEAVLPQIVKAAPFDLDENNNSKSGENYKTVQYERLVPLLIEAINELQAKVKALESK